MSLNEYKKRLARLPSKPTTSPVTEEEEKTVDPPKSPEWFEKSGEATPEEGREPMARMKVKTLPAVPAYAGTAKVEEKPKVPSMLSMTSYPRRKEDDSSE